MIDLLAFGHTKRLHTVQTIGQQTVAEHSGRVAILAMQIMRNDPPARVLMACLTHDLAEFCTGDIPAPVKWRNPQLNLELKRIEDRFEVENDLFFGLDTYEKNVLKWADALELAFHAVDQLMLGNRNMDTVYQNIMSHIDKLPYCNESADELYELVKEKYHGTTR